MMAPPPRPEDSSKPPPRPIKKTSSSEDTLRVIRRFSSIKLDFEKEKRKTLSRFQNQGLRAGAPKKTTFFSTDPNEIRKRLRVSVERYSMPELYVKMVCALFPEMNSRENPATGKDLIRHLKQVFRLNELEHAQLMDIARTTKLPQRIINLEVVEAKNIPAKDTNGLSDPFCTVFVNSRDVAQRTSVQFNTLNPVWKQYISFKVNDPNRDTLVLEVMDFNEDDDSLRTRIKKIKGVTSVSTLGILLKEIANARSIQELIGTVRIPVSEISSETVDKWFKLKNYEDQGEIHLRMALGYNKSKEAATEEFLQITHFLLCYELDRDPLGNPFYWDEHYEGWSKYILRQFKWQGGLKPKDIVLAKWRAYTVINSIFNLNANMMCLLLSAVLERVATSEYESREMMRFWECTELYVNTIINFLKELHEVLPCPVTILNTFHMLKSIEVLNNFGGKERHPGLIRIPYTVSTLTDRVVKAIRDGANKFYEQVFSDSTYESIKPDQDPLYLALERLLRMGQILQEDLRLGQSIIDNDFKAILGIDYLRITYQVYDEKYGKIVKFIMDEYSDKLLDPSDPESECDEDFDESCPAVKSGLAVLRLYFAVKSLAEVAPPDYAKDNDCEYSLNRHFHSWFFHSVATWIDIIRNRIIRCVKNSISLAEENHLLSTDTSSSKLFTTDQHSKKEIPISSSAIDTAQFFHEIQTFWVSLGWQDPQQSYLIVRKILEELYGYLIYYAAELLETVTRHEPMYEARMEDIDSYMVQACAAVNNINYVKEQVELLAQQLNISNIIHKLTISNNAQRKAGSKSSNPNHTSDDYEAEIDGITGEMQSKVCTVSDKIIKSIVKAILPKFKHLLHDVTVETSRNATKNKRFSVNRLKYLIEFLDACLITLNVNLKTHNFYQALGELWLETVDAIELRVKAGQEVGSSPEYFQKCSDLLLHLFTLFWPKDVELAKRMESPFLFEKFEELKARLADLELSLVDLKMRYYESRYKRQQLTPVAVSEHGSVTIRAGSIDRGATVVVEIMNARNLKAYDSNDSSDPYAIVSLVPKENFLSTPTFTTKHHKETLFPLFEETFSIPLAEEDRQKKGFVMITLYDYDFLGRDDLMGETLIPLSGIKEVESSGALEKTQQIHLAISKPSPEDTDVLQLFEVRHWDREAVRFAKAEKEKFQS